nr:hypothetical protein [Vibrio cholerae]CPR29042.1 hypothetical protein [Vibrio cholerae]
MHYLLNDVNQFHSVSLLKASLFFPVQSENKQRPVSLF